MIFSLFYFSKKALRLKVGESKVEAKWRESKKDKGSPGRKTPSHRKWSNGFFLVVLILLEENEW